MYFLKKSSPRLKHIIHVGIKDCQQFSNPTYYIQVVNRHLQLNSLFAQLVTFYQRLIYQNPNSFKRPFGIDINTTKNLTS